MPDFQTAKEIWGWIKDEVLSLPGSMVQSICDNDKLKLSCSDNHKLAILALCAGFIFYVGFECIRLSMPRRRRRMIVQNNSSTPHE